MKKFLQSFALIAVLGITTTFAQSSIDSPHNYKRYSVPQKKAPVNGFTSVVTPQASYQFQHNLTSLHNYKRQGKADFSSEALLSFSVPAVKPNALNPLVLPNNYKIYFRPLTIDEQIARKDTGTQPATQQDSTGNK